MADLIEETRHGVLRLTFNRPESRNAFTFGMYDAMKAALDRLTVDGPVRAVILSGAGGKAFAAGTDMTQFRAFDKPEDAWAYEARIDAAMTSVEACPVPVIAAITGACTGGGAGIAAAADIRVCDAGLRYGFPIARTLGNCMALANLRRLGALIGAGRAKELILTARLIGAEEALAAGLVSEVVDDPMARAEEIAETLKGHAPLTMHAAKEGMRRLAEGRTDDRDLVALCYMSEDFRQGMEAFLAKRKPVWRGR